MERMQREAEEAKVQRALLVANIHEKTHAWGAQVIEVFAIGTAVEEISKDHVIETTRF